MGVLQMKIYNEIDEGNKIAKKMLYFLLFAILPFLGIFFLYINDPEAPILNAIAASTSNLPAVLSFNNPLLSKVMDVYTKTSPLFAFVLFMVSYKNLSLKKESSACKALVILVLFTVFYAILIYSFLFTNTELTKSAKLLKLMSINDFYLAFFYVSLYSGIYIFSYLYMWFCIGTFRVVKERW